MNTREQILGSKMGASDAETQKVVIVLMALLNIIEELIWSLS
jgi:hypothetical protein